MQLLGRMLKSPNRNGMSVQSNSRTNRKSVDEETSAKGRFKWSGLFLRRSEAVSLKDRGISDPNFHICVIEKNRAVMG